MFTKILNQFIVGQDLSRQQAQEAMQMIMSGNATEAQIGSFLTALRMKGETSEEIAGFAETMRSYTVKITCNQQGRD